MPELTQVLQVVTAIGQLGTVATVMFVGWYFLEFIKRRDKETNEATREFAREIKAGLEEMRDDLLAAIRDQDARTQQTIVTLFDLTRRTVETIGTLSTSIAELSRSVQEQRLAIQELRSLVHGGPGTGGKGKQTS